MFTSGINLEITEIEVKTEIYKVFHYCKFLFDILVIGIRPMVILSCMRAQSVQLCLTLCELLDCRPSMGSAVHGLRQARILECVAMAFSRGSSRPRD